MGVVADGGTLGRALDGHEGHRKQGMLGGANLPAYIRTMGIIPLSFVESKVSLVKTRVTRSLFPPPACPTIS